MHVKRVVVVAVAALGVGAAVAAAAIPGRDGTINACYDLKKGDLRVVDEGVPCTKNEGALSWNQGLADPPPPPPTGKIHSATVDWDGRLNAGDAVSVHVHADKSYRVTFAEAVGSCTATISLGVNQNGGSVSLHAVGNVDLSGTDAVVEWMVPPSTDNTETGFHLIVVC